MVSWFKKLRIVQIIVFSVLGAIWLGFSSYFIFCDMNTEFYVSLLIFWIIYFVLLFAFGIAATYKHNKLTELLNNDCDAVKFINEYYPLLQRSKNKRARALVIVNLAAGYADAGDTNNAKNALCSLDVADISVSLTRALYYSVWTSVFEKENDIQNAKQTLSIMKNIIDNEIKKTALQERCLHIYNCHTANINLQSGCYDRIEEILRDEYSNAPHMIEKVSIHYMLGELYLKTGRIDDAKYSLRFVVENGATLAIAKEARQKLDELSRQNAEKH